MAQGNHTHSKHDKNKKTKEPQVQAKPEHSNRWRWTELVVGGTAVAIIAGAYYLGRDMCDNACKAEILNNKTEAQRQLAVKEDEIRQSSHTIASLQALLQLKKKDRNRLLEAATIIPPVRLSYEGQPLKDKIFIGLERIKDYKPKVRGYSITLPILLENTGNIDIQTTGITYLTSDPFGGSYAAPRQIIQDGDKKINEFSVELNALLSPGARRYVEIIIGKEHGNSKPPIEIGDVIPTTITLYSSEHLPLGMSVIFVIQ